jgi:CHAD domain-containing protein
MSYRFEANETISECLKRIASEQCEIATEKLKAQGVSRDDAIHDARVCFKKIRAVLRLARNELDKDTYTQENIYYRDAGRRLSAVRDTAAVIETIDKLTERYAEQLAADPFKKYRTAFLQENRKRQSEKKKALSEVRRTMKAAQKRIDDWPMNGDKFSVIGEGLKRVYKDGRLSFARAYDQVRVESFHDWRKQVKYLLYDVRIIKPVWKRVLGGMADELKKLASSLSDMQDLFILRQKVSEQVDGSSPDKDLEVLVALIDQRIQEIQVMTRPIGERIYIEKSRNFLSRFDAYWNAWRSESRMESIANLRESS